MNLYYIDAGEIRFYAKKTDAERAARDIADERGEEINISRMFIAVDRENITRMANKERGFNRFIGRVCVVKPRKRPKLKLKRVAAVLSLLATLLSPNPSEANSCTTRRSGSVVITSCSGKNFTSQCRSYRSGSIIKTYCR
jgi:hypothetical protein